MITEWISNWWYTEAALEFQTRSFIVLFSVAFVAGVVHSVRERDWDWLGVWAFIAPVSALILALALPAILWPLFWAVGL